MKNIKEKNYSLKFLGYSNTPIKTGNLIGNRFEITIKDLTQEQTKDIQKRINILNSKGIINYFDSQRFGNVVNNIFIAKYLAKRDYENALYYFLISQYSNYKSSEDNDEYEKLKKQWKNFGNLKINLPYLFPIQKKYNETKSFKVAYKQIPSRLRELIAMSYQSYLWNECIKTIVKQNKNYFTVDYNIGELYFTDKTLKEESFPMIGRNLETNNENMQIISQILKKEDITLKEIEDISKSGSFLKTQEREIVIFPKNLKLLKLESDETYSTNENKRFKVTIKFELPKGSYATVLVKELFKE